MVTTITDAELAAHLSDILDRVRENGEKFIVERDGRRVAKLEPAGPAPITWGEFLKRYRDFPKPDDGYWEELEKVLAERSRMQQELPEWPN